jgi:SWI/SNF-related matrix-associated actin-dependent regulator of chromatin subfamily A3
MEGSIEEQVLTIQEDKRKLMALALSEKKATERGAKKERRMADIMKLLG